VADVGSLGRFVAYVTTKQALAGELFAANREAEVFMACRVALGVDEPLPERAQESGPVRRLDRRRARSSAGSQSSRPPMLRLTIGS
jgi:hypothetical protein